MRVTKPRVDTTQAGKKTTRERTHQIGDHRHFVSGGSAAVKAYTLAEREVILSSLPEGGRGLQGSCPIRPGTIDEGRLGLS